MSYSYVRAQGNAASAIHESEQSQDDGLDLHDVIIAAVVRREYPSPDDRIVGWTQGEDRIGIAHGDDQRGWLGSTGGDVEVREGEDSSEYVEAVRPETESQERPEIGRIGEHDGSVGDRERGERGELVVGVPVPPADGVDAPARADERTRFVVAPTHASGPHAVSVDETLHAHAILVAVPTILAARPGIGSPVAGMSLVAQGHATRSHFAVDARVDARHAIIPDAQVLSGAVEGVVTLIRRVAR